MNKSIVLLAFTLLQMYGCCLSENSLGIIDSGLKRADFQIEKAGKKTDLFVLRNKNGMEVCITNYGGRIVSIMVPDVDGNMRDVVLGFDSIQDYIKYPTDFGATIGRYANRIKCGKTIIAGVEYQFPQNNFGHCLHGGFNGFQDQIFDVNHRNDTKLVLSYLSKDMEEGFPGNLKCEVTFVLTPDNTIDISYAATTDKTTIVNMTNHSYFNLDGDPSRDNSDYLLTIDADYYTPVDSTFMTSGKIVSVAHTEMDFREARLIGSGIDNYSFDQLKNGDGYDHNWVLNTECDIAKSCARIVSTRTGIVLDVFTTEPGIQFYAGNFLDGSLVGKGGITYNRRAAVCLETQKYPDTPNKPTWPSAELKPGERYESRCIYKFSTSDKQ